MPRRSCVEDERALPLEIGGTAPDSAAELALTGVSWRADRSDIRRKRHATEQPVSLNSRAMAGAAIAYDRSSDRTYHPTLVAVTGGDEIHWSPPGNRGSQSRYSER